MKQLNSIKYREIVRCLSFVGMALVLLSCVGYAQRSATAVSTIRVTVVNPSNDMSVNKNLFSHLTHINNLESDTNTILSSGDLLHQRLANVNTGEDIVSTNLYGELDQQFLDMWIEQDRDTQVILDDKGIMYLRSLAPLGSLQSKMTEIDTTLTIVSVTD
jgi:hypothetical protein